jgi:tRNA-Thr(GGU) m(6)t(6)A37 methyltransferase TsaA
MQIVMLPIGVVRTDAKEIPKHWSCSNAEGTLIIEEQYRQGLYGIKRGDRIIVIFCFHKSRGFTAHDITQHPRGDTTREKLGVFDICSPIRPNPIGMSIVEVTDIRDSVISIKGLDMIDGTPILDIKPSRHIMQQENI